MIDLAYTLAVDDPKRLNNYKAFSDQTYGELSFNSVIHILEILRPSSDEIFMDLGSGIGHVVLQMSAMYHIKKCVGIEIAEVPANFAARMSTTFTQIMKWLNKSYAEFELIKGDFFAEEYRQRIFESTIIFVNNMAFSAETNNKLEQIVMGLPIGTRIVCTSKFCAKRRNSQNSWNVQEVLLERGGVTWTDNQVKVYILTIKEIVPHYIEKLNVDDVMTEVNEDTEMCQQGVDIQESLQSNDYEMSEYSEIYSSTRPATHMPVAENSLQISGSGMGDEVDKKPKGNK